MLFSFLLFHRGDRRIDPCRKSQGYWRIVSWQPVDKHAACQGTPVQMAVLVLHDGSIRGPHMCMVKSATKAPPAQKTPQGLVMHAWMFGTLCILNRFVLVQPKIWTRGCIFGGWLFWYLGSPPIVDLHFESMSGRIQARRTSPPFCRIAYSAAFEG